MQTPDDFSRAQDALTYFSDLLGVRLTEQRAYYAATFGPLRADLPALIRRYFQEEERTREEVRSVLAHARVHAALPASVSSAALYMLSRRCICAGEFLGECFPPQSVASPWAESRGEPLRILFWLLDDLWVRRFDLHLKLTALAVHGPFPYFGLEAAAPGE